MSAYSSSSQDDAYYSSPGPMQYRLVTPGMLDDPRSMSQVSPGFIYVNFLSQSLLYAPVFALAITSFLFSFLFNILSAVQSLTNRRIFAWGSFHNINRRSTLTLLLTLDV